MSAVDLWLPGRPGRAAPQPGAKFFSRANAAAAAGREKGRSRAAARRPTAAYRGERSQDSGAPTASPPPTELLRSRTGRGDRIWMFSVAPRLKHPPGDGGLQAPPVFTLQVGSLVRTHPFILAGPSSRQSISARPPGRRPPLPAKDNSPLRRSQPGRRVPPPSHSVTPPVCSWDGEMRRRPQPSGTERTMGDGWMDLCLSSSRNAAVTNV